jgi:hypothetical protein
LSRRRAWFSSASRPVSRSRRLLNDLDSYAAATARQGEDEEIVAHDWMADVFEPVQRAVPREMRGKLEAAELFHEVLEHRWYLSERAGRDVGLEEAVNSYVVGVLPQKPDERAVLGVDTQSFRVIAD